MQTLIFSPPSLPLILLRLMSVHLQILMIQPRLYGYGQLQCLQERQQVGFLLFGKAYAKALVVKIDHGLEVFRKPIVEVRARAASPRRIGPLKRPMSFHFPVISARPGSVVTLISPVFLFCKV